MVDNRTGKRYEIAISDHGTIQATDLKQIKAGGDGVGLRTFDNGWVGVQAARGGKEGRQEAGCRGCR